MDDRRGALPDIYDGRMEIAAAGLRPQRVFIVKRYWSGEMAGIGEATEEATEILPRPKVSTIPVSAAWGGLYAPGDLMVSKITPQHEDPNSPGTLRGTSQAMIAPTLSAATEEVLYMVTHDDDPDQKAYYSLVSTDYTSLFEYKIALRRRTEAQSGYFETRNP